MKTGSNLAIPASLTGGATILSVVTGAISGVSPGTILIRGVVTAVLSFRVYLCLYLANKNLFARIDGRGCTKRQ